MTHKGAPALLAGTALAALLAAGWLHAANRERALVDFQDHQLHTADAFADVLRSELSGSARTLQTLAAAIAAQPNGGRATPQIDAQTQCWEAPCFTGLATYDADGGLVYATVHPPEIDATQVQDALLWARSANTAAVRALVPKSRIPALLVAVPASPGILVAQVDFDSLFGGTADRPNEWRQYATVVFDPAGTVVFHSRRPEMRLNNPMTPTAKCATCHTSFDHVKRLVAMQRGVLRYELQGTARLAAVAPVSFAGGTWVAAVMAPAEHAVGVLSDEVRELGLLAFAAIVIMGGAVYQMSKTRTNEALKTMNGRLESAAIEWRTTVDSIDAAVVVLDPAHAIERMNRAAAATLPGPLWSWTNRPSEALRAHEPWDTALDLAHAAAQAGATQSQRVTTRDGKETWDLWCRTFEGRRSPVVVVARNVTGVIALQESVRRSETMAALGSVVAGVAHEVRNPLFAISSMVDALGLQRHGDLTPFLAALRTEVSRLNTLMTELLEYGTPTTVTLKRQPLAAVVAEAMHACAPQAEARGVTLVHDGDGADLHVWMDARRLVRVFINVIQNAIQHTEPGSRVVIAIEGHASNPWDVTVRVRDRGPGFAPEDLPRVFKPFFSRRAGGCGLGLAICERIVSEHGGCIVAANAMDGGGLVTIDLPRRAPVGVADAPEGALP
ncbi:MAG TPA: ATP-binding protein [Vicinamibacterales bacterium]|nr:ATP-binding protein [Vicinamibacterales bacterium]